MFSALEIKLEFVVGTTSKSDEVNANLFPAALELIAGFHKIPKVGL